MKINIVLLLLATMFSLSASAANLSITANNIGQKTAKIKSAAVKVINGKFHIIVSTKKNNFEQMFTCNFNGKFLSNSDVMDLYKEIRANLNHPKYNVVCNSSGNASRSNGHFRVYVGDQASEAFYSRIAN